MKELTYCNLAGEDEKEIPFLEMNGEQKEKLGNMLCMRPMECLGYRRKEKSGDTDFL
ncbi:hypothetical protein [Clostridium sp. AM58-1XD]|uniref:hypothetical protein n=1 Tax=Clostridium sp. AM58-1XD TaxID=2292307 RepID=UPI0015F4D647|nr:hypothetical protein [Clostridium sp. AM58-1XD]